MTTPTIQRRRLGNALRQARERAGLTQDEAAARIDAVGSKISRLELGQSGIKLTDLGILLDYYGVGGEEADLLRELARAGRARGRWSGYRAVVPDWFRQYLDLETDASELRWYQPEVVPGLLQTEGYIRAMLTSGQPRVPDEEVEQQIRVRLERTRILDRPDAPQLHVILSESALRRNVGGPAVLGEQLRALADAAQRPTIDLQVLPFDAQTFGAAWHGFTIMRFDDDSTTDVVYLEDYIDASYLDRLDEVRAYSKLWDRLRAAALGPVESQRFILKLAAETASHPH